MKKEKVKNNQIEEDNAMIVETAVKIDNNIFNQFLSMNKEKIDLVVPKNPSIKKEDEWRQENFWDEEIEGND